ncbi:MAG: hypothetical protein PHS40_10630, partial [Mariniphaga sp.]|nr:hypothetical protein [Mariniphaga sp.]
IILAGGYLLDWTSITPTINRISTSSFVMASGGWSVLALALSYWFIDIKKINKWIFPFVIVGMNPIFIYMFSQTIGGQWFNEFTGIFVHGILGWFNASEFLMALMTSLTVLALEWLLCYYLFLKKIFFKI